MYPLAEGDECSNEVPIRPHRFGHCAEFTSDGIDGLAVDELPNGGLSVAVIDRCSRAVEVKVFRHERRQEDVAGVLVDHSSDMTVEVDNLGGRLPIKRLTIEALEAIADGGG